MRMFRTALFSWACAFLVVVPSAAQDMPLSQVLIPGEGWELVGEGYRFTEGPARGTDGSMFFVDVPASRVYRVDEKGKIRVFAGDSNRTSGLAVGSKGQIFACQNGAARIGYYEPNGKYHVIAEKVPCNDLAVTPRDELYVTDPKNGQIWHIKPDGTKKVVARGLKPNGIIVSPGGGSLIVTDRDEPLLWTYRIREDGSLDAKEPYYAPLTLPSGKERPGSDGMAMDADGRLYVATHAGLQMFDPTGRQGGVIAKPQNKFLSNVCFGGPGNRYLYVTCADRVYRRKVKPKGAR